MLLVTVRLPDGNRRLGLVTGERVIDLTACDPLRFASFISLLHAAESAQVDPKDLIQPWAEAPHRWLLAELDRPASPDMPYLDKPLQPEEIWAAGVTYERSRNARESESKGSSFYDKVYHAERPELFFKATGRRSVGPNQPVGLRNDSRWQVPEPELALVIGTGRKIVGYTIGNDMSCRDIEGENPLYLPQAKVYKQSCAFGPAVLLAEPTGHPCFEIGLKIFRAGALLIERETSTAQLKRTFEDLVHYLSQDNDLCYPTLLFTGTGIVPPDDFTLCPGDRIEISISGIGTLRNLSVRIQG